jgi:hypothetical protein
MKLQIFNLFFIVLVIFLNQKYKYANFFSINLKPQKSFDFKKNYFGEFLLIKRRVVTKATSI